MTPQIVVIVLGGILILAGLLGGGFELKELKLPRVAGAARVLSLLAGIVLLGLGLNMKVPQHGDGGRRHETQTEGKETPPPAPKPHMGVLEFDINRQGSDIRYFQTGSANECADACVQNDECRAMTFVQGTTGGTCWLKNTVPPNTPRPGMISSVKAF